MVYVLEQKIHTLKGIQCTDKNHKEIMGFLGDLIEFAFPQEQTGELKIISEGRKYHIHLGDWVVKWTRRNDFPRSRVADFVICNSEVVNKVFQLEIEDRST